MAEDKETKDVALEDNGSPPLSQNRKRSPPKAPKISIRKKKKSTGLKQILIDKSLDEMGAELHGQDLTQENLIKLNGAELRDKLIEKYKKKGGSLSCNKRNKYVLGWFTGYAINALGVPAKDLESLKLEDPMVPSELFQNKEVAAFMVCILSVFILFTLHITFFT